jgi:hypothetical protein
MREFHGLACSQVDLFDTVPFRDCPGLLHLGWGYHPGGYAEPDDTEIGIAFRNDPTFCIEALIDWHAA